MSKIRAYKLAEELEIDKDEFVEKVKALGIELKSATSALTEEQAAEVRSTFDVPIERSPRPAMDERRLERKGGSAVIRRRKRAEPEPPPVPEPEPVTVVEVVAE